MRCWRGPAAQCSLQGPVGPRAARVALGTPPPEPASCGASLTDSGASPCAWRGWRQCTAWTRSPSRGLCRASAPGPRLPCLSKEVTAAPNPESRLREGERACLTRSRFVPFVLVPLAGRSLRRLGEMVTSSDFGIGSPCFWSSF